MDEGHGLSGRFLGDRGGGKIAGKAVGVHESHAAGLADDVTHAATGEVRRGDGGDEGLEETDAGASGPVVLAPQSGRFYHRPSPGEPAFVEVGGELSPGAPIGLIEVMKTFKARIVLPMHAFGGYSMRQFLTGMSDAFAVVVHDGPTLDISFQTLPGEPTVMFLPNANPGLEPGYGLD